MMIRRTIPLLACVLLLAAPLLSSTSLFGQEDPRRVRVSPKRATAYKLDHVTPQYASGLLHGLLVDEPARIVSDPRSGQLLVITNDRVHQQITELLATIDVPSAPSKEDPLVTRIIRLHHRTIESVLPAISEVEHMLVLSAIAATNSLVVNGTEEQIAALEELVRSLDVEAASLTLECWILAPDAKNKIAKDPVLARVEPELAKTGLTGYGTLSHMTIRSLSGEKFRSRQEFSDRRVRETNLSGKVRLSSELNALISFDLRVMLEFEGQDGNRDSAGSFSLSTELKSQVGKLVVVGLAPTGNEDSKPLVLVMRVGT